MTFMPHVCSGSSCVDGSVMALNGGTFEFPPTSVPRRMTAAPELSRKNWPSTVSAPVAHAGDEKRQDTAATTTPSQRMPAAYTDRDVRGTSWRHRHARLDIVFAPFSTVDALRESNL